MTTQRAIEVLKESIVRIVDTAQGIKGMELVAQVAMEIPYLCQHADVREGDLSGILTKLPMIFDQLVKEKKILEIEYTIPSLNYRVKSFYLPAGSEVTFT